MDFRQKLDAVMKKSNSLVCVGLDSDITKIPATIREGEHPQSTFNQAIIDATHDLVCAYKPNVAFYEARGPEGIEDLKLTCNYIKEHCPGVVIILDAKRADIGSTNEGYATFTFDYLGADAITLHPYLGREALEPFLRRKEKGSIILCKTSNAGSGELQNLNVDSGNQHIALYQHLAQKVAKDWNYNGNCALVVGATYPKELAIVRRLVGDMPLLIPGIGAQGGDVQNSVKAGIDANGKGAIINAARSIIFASNGADFAQSARKEALALRDKINQFRF